MIKHLETEEQVLRWHWVTRCCFPVVLQAWRPLDCAGVFRRGEEAVAGSSGWNRSCKNIRALFPIRTADLVHFQVTFVLITSVWEQSLLDWCLNSSGSHAALQSVILGRQQCTHGWATAHFSSDLPRLCPSDWLCFEGVSKTLNFSSTRQFWVASTLNDCRVV